MEINNNRGGNNPGISFKIDLIVWKLVLPINEEDYSYRV